MNVLWIVSDTCRPDLFGVNGGDTHTPNLDALARKSANFQRAQAASFPTVPTRVDYMTGTYGLTDIGWGPLPQGTVTLPQLLTRAGAVTVGVVDTPFFTQRGFNYDRGFRYFYDIPVQHHRPGARGPAFIPEPRVTEFDHCAAVTMTTAEKCLEYLRNERFFLYVDTWDPHEPFDPPEWYVERYLPGYDGRQVYPVYGPIEEFGVPEEDVRVALACYKGKLTMTDRWIGRLLDRLDSLNLLDRTAVLFSSDHGFYFGEHGLFGKMLASEARGQEQRRQSWRRSPLYRELSDVPLMVSIPEARTGPDKRIVSNIDLAPTVLDLMDVTVPEQFMGQSLVPLVHDPDLAGREIAITAAPLADPGQEVALVDDIMRRVDEWQPLTVTSESWSLLFARWSEPIELYDLERDPHQLTNVADDYPEVVKDLHGKMIAELERAGARQAAIEARS